MHGSRVLVTGCSGFLGEHLAGHLARQGYAVVGTWHTRPVNIPLVDALPLDLVDAAAVARLLRDLRPAAIVHCAAMTDAAKCQLAPLEARDAILRATENLAQAVRQHISAARVIAISTDLVFDGEAAPYAPTDPPKPLSEYGSLKYAAERPISELEGGAVVRAALMYGAPATHKGSFIAWMARTLAEGRPLELFEDEIRTPVFVGSLCEGIAAMLGRRENGVWHAGGPERLSRLEMGRRLCRLLHADEKLLVPKRLADSQYPAPRPRDVSLISDAFWEMTGVPPITFDQGLQTIAQ